MWLFSGVNVFMMTFPVFVVVQKIDAPSSAWLSRVASMTFGIYLCHFVIVQMGYDLYEAVLPQGVPAVVKIVCNAVTVFAVSYLLVRLLSLNAYTRRLVA